MNKISNNELKSNQRVILLAQEFKKLGNYPKKNSPNGSFLNIKRQAFKNYTNGTKHDSLWYPSDIEVAKDHGLPDDWMLVTKSHDPAILEKESNQRTILIAQEFKKIGTYPNCRTKIGKTLVNKRSAFKHYTNRTKNNHIWYPSDIEVAKLHGLPDDWMKSKSLHLTLHDPAILEKESNQKTILLAKEFKKIGTYPSGRTKIGSFLRIRRLAFKHYTNRTKNINRWYPSDIEVAKLHGLPDDWIFFKKQKSESLGEKRTRFILEKFNIKITPQYRHKLCANERCLPFDFYIHKDNLHYFIEYNGEQHYRPIFRQKNITKEEIFKKTQKNDLIKLNFCKKNNYPLLVIPYWIKDFENLISEFLKTTQFDPKFAQPIIPNLPELN